jgi:hypothetical protein
MVLLKKALILAVLLLIPNAKVFADEWDNTSAEDMGISQEEFQKVKESGMSKSRFLKLLEVGISPNEYFSEPWKKLGVTEEHWLREKKGGMADDDIDRNYRKQDANNMMPFLSFILPGYYQYKTQRPIFGASLSGLAVAGIALTFIHKDKESKNIIPFYPIVALGAMLTSAGDAYLGTRYLDNQEAGRFSWNLGLNGFEGPAALLSFRF